MKSKMKLLGMTVFAVLGTIVLASLSLNDQLEWFSWKVKYNKKYETKESEKAHRKIWQRNKVYVEGHNRRTDVTFKMELNHLADQEAPRRPLIQNHNNDKRSQNSLLFAPADWDWRQHGAVSPVHNQGPISDSISVVAEECVESYHVIHAGSLLRLSEEEVYDCCAKAQVIQPDVFECIHGLGGLCKEADYPSSNRCRNNSCTAAAQIDGGLPVAKGDENDLKEKVYITPVLAVINAGLTSFQLYRGGVYEDRQCTSSTLDHALQVVGYGSQNGTDYWICKNSWGTFWGDKGYILIARNKGNMCGIASAALYPV